MLAGLNWFDDAPKGGKTVPNRILRDGASAPCFTRCHGISTLNLPLTEATRRLYELRTRPRLPDGKR